MINIVPLLGAHVAECQKSGELTFAGNELSSRAAEPQAGNRLQDHPTSLCRLESHGVSVWRFFIVSVCTVSMEGMAVVV